MIPLILSGGSGTRLWPVSRSAYPKQFCDFYDHSFLQSAINRLNHIGPPLILTVESMRSLTTRALTENNLELSQAYYEPFGKNTGPAIALICKILELQNKQDEVVGVFPADHLISNQEQFLKVINAAAEAAESGRVVTLGIPPVYPSTGYGYIECVSTEEASKELVALDVLKFHEKPELELATKYCKSGQHFWNSGIFIFKASAMIDNFKTHLPEVWEPISKIDPDLKNLKYQYANIESVSIDYGIMEKLTDTLCIPADMGWSDVGSWDELARLDEEMPEINSDSHARVINHDSRSNYVFSVKNKVVGLIGVERLLVVDTPDALLISKKGRSQDVKALVDTIRVQGLGVADEHVFEKRPWGGFEVLSDDENYKAKTVTVDPGRQLSYQSHNKREEHWIIISGEAEVTLEGEVKSYKKGSYIFVPRMAKHRIKNCGTSPLVFVEVQSGEYFGEDDIVRYEDDYNRVPEV